MVEVHLYKVFLLLSSIETFLNLVKRFFWAEMRLVIQCFDLFFSSLSHLLLHDLVLEELSILRILVLPVLRLQVLHPVHVLHGRVELILFVLPNLPYILRLFLVAGEGLLVDAAHGFVGVGPFVLGVVVDGEGPLRSHELRHGCVARIRDLLAIEGSFNV